MESPLAQTNQWPVPHVAAAVITSAGIIAQHGDQNRKFRLASISKVLTGYATLIAVEEGSVKLDDEIETSDGSQSGLPVGKEPTGGTRSEAEMGPARSKQGSQSGLPVGKEPTGGTRSEADMGPARPVQGSQSGLPVGKEPTRGTQSEAEMGPARPVKGSDLTTTSAPFTLRQLLSHAAGFGFDSGSEQQSRPQTRRMYSNEGIERAARIVEVNTGMPFAEYLREAIFEPLRMGDSELRGSPAANVSSTVADLSRFATELLKPTLLAPETFTDFTRCQFPALAGMLPGIGRFDPLPWGLGVEIKGNKHPHWSGQFTSPATFGHFGGSGTFLWVDPTRGLAAIALADRDFGAWAMAAWPQLSDAIVNSYTA
jgi:CubicO group peptidase (beta-lactamase class C family)